MRRRVYKNVLKASGEKLQNAVPFVTNDKDGTDGAGKSGDDATTVIAPAESEGEQTKTLSAEESDETTVMTSVDGDTTTAMPQRQAVSSPPRRPEDANRTCFRTMPAEVSSMLDAGRRLTLGCMASVRRSSSRSSARLSAWP